MLAVIQQCKYNEWHFLGYEFGNSPVLCQLRVKHRQEQLIIEAVAVSSWAVTRATLKVLTLRYSFNVLRELFIELSCICEYLCCNIDPPIFNRTAYYCYDIFYWNNKIICCRYFNYMKVYSTLPNDNKAMACKQLRNYNICVYFLLHL
jgi:hypothetical protein